MSEYPGLESLKEPELQTISAIYLGIRSAERFLLKVQSGEPTGSVEGELLNVRKELDWLKNEVEKFSRYNPPLVSSETLGKFITDHEILLVDTTTRAKEIIGDKKRTFSGNCVYR